MLSWARKNVAGVVLWSLWIGSALQPVALAWEFWGLELQHCGWEAWYYARFYSHIFVYPVTFGLLSTWFLQRPFHEVLDYLRERRILFIVIVFLIFVVVVAVSYAEFSESTGAIWEFSPQVLKQYPSGTKAREILSNQCWAAETTAEPYSHLSDASASADAYYDYLDQFSFSRLLKNLEARGEQQSLTNIAYHIGFVSMAALFMILFVTFFITLALMKDCEKQGPLSRLANALFFASFWVLMRITFMVEKFTIFKVEDDRLFIFNFFIFLLFLFALTNLLTALKNKPDTDSHNFDFKYNSFSILGIMELFLSITGFASQMLETHYMSDILVHLFGTRNDPLTYPFIGLFLLLVFFPSILRALNSSYLDKGLKKPFRARIKTR